MQTDVAVAADPACSKPSDWVQYRPGAMAGVTMMRAHFTEHAFERHSHPEYGIGLTYSGIQTFHCRGALQTSAPGHVIFLNPDQAHDGLPGVADGYGYAMLYVGPEVMAQVPERAAGTLGSAYFRDAVVHDPQAARRLLAVVDAIGQAQEALREQTLMLGAFLQLLSRHGERPQTALAPVPAGQRRLRRVRDYIHAHAERDISVAELACEAGVSRVYLSRAFEQHFGVPPHIYLNAVRLAHARRLLLTGAPLAAVAAAAGFADQSHFSRRFKGATGLSPGVWLRQMQRK